VGKKSVAEYIAARILSVSENHLNEYPYIKIISGGDKAISIDVIRETESFLKLKVPSKRSVSRVVIIEDGHTMTGEAQNALLKTLEEPPSDTIIITTSISKEAVLPTIASRAQNIAVHAPPISELKVYFESQGHQASKVSQAIAMSGGLPGLIYALLTDEKHPLAIAANEVKVILNASAFERLTVLDRTSKDKQLLEDVIFIMQQMAHISLQKAEAEQARRWQRILEESLTASERLLKHGQPKLTALHLALHL
jgi:DNA polymerase III subunit delta'